MLRSRRCAVGRRGSEGGRPPDHLGCSPRACDAVAVGRWIDRRAPAPPAMGRIPRRRVASATRPVRSALGARLWQ
eukprot:5593548-Alexandrium_andersonii.AAC.1